MLQNCIQFVLGESTHGKSQSVWNSVWKNLICPTTQSYFHFLLCKFLLVKDRWLANRKFCVKNSKNWKFKQKAKTLKSKLKKLLKYVFYKVNWGPTECRPNWWTKFFRLIKWIFELSRKLLFTLVWPHFLRRKVFKKRCFEEFFEKLVPSKVVCIGTKGAFRKKFKVSQQKMDISK